MKLLTTVAVIIGVVCMATFYAGNAHAVSLGDCMDACKGPLGLNCHAMTGQARAGCNHDCMISCTPGGAGGGVQCLSDACPAGVDSATGFFDVANGSMSVCQKLTEGGVGAPWLYSLVADTVAGPGFAGAPAHYECNLTLIPGEANVTMFNVNRDPVTNCMVDEDTPITDFQFTSIVGGVPVLMGWDDVKALDIDVQIQTCLADAGILVDLNTNPCPVGNVCNCFCAPELVPEWTLVFDSDFGPYELRRCRSFMPDNPNACHTSNWTAPPYAGGYVNYKLYYYEGGDINNPTDCKCVGNFGIKGGLYRDYDLYPDVCWDRDTLEVIPPSAGICIPWYDDEFDDDNDLGLDACIGDHYLDLDNDPNTPDVLTIDYNDCIYKVAQGLTEQQKRWAAIMVGLAGSGDPQPVAKLIEDGFLGDLANPPVLYVLEDEVNCSLDIMIDALKDLE